MSTSRRRPGGRLRRAVFILLALIVLAGASGHGLSAVDRMRYRPAGDMVAVNGHRLHLLCRGQGTPTVVVEAGSGGWSGDWALVQEPVAGFTRICTYDRAGLGWSDAGPLPRSGERIADELHTLLTRAGEQGPYVLVGHSLGGLYSLLFARRHPDQVQGVVLVDARPVGLRLALDEAGFRMMRVGGALARSGILRLLAGVLLPPRFADLPSEVRGPYALLASRYQRFVTQQAEFDELTGLEAALEGLDLGDRPLVVLSHGLPLAAGADEVERIWEQGQRGLAGLSSRSEHLIARRSGHNIMLEQPEAVVDAVRRVVTRVREGL